MSKPMSRKRICHLIDGRMITRREPLPPFTPFSIEPRMSSRRKVIPRLRSLRQASAASARLSRFFAFGYRYLRPPSRAVRACSSVRAGCASRI